MRQSRHESKNPAADWEIHGGATRKRDRTTLIVRLFRRRNNIVDRYPPRLPTVSTQDQRKPVFAKEPSDNEPDRCEHETNNRGSHDEFSCQEELSLSGGVYAAFKTSVYKRNSLKHTLHRDINP